MWCVEIQTEPRSNNTHKIYIHTLRIEELGELKREEGEEFKSRNRRTIRNLLRNALYSAIDNTERREGLPSIYIKSVRSFTQKSGDWSIEGTMNAWFARLHTESVEEKRWKSLWDNRSKLWELRVTQANENGKSSSFDHISIT